MSYSEQEKVIIEEAKAIIKRKKELEESHDPSVDHHELFTKWLNRKGIDIDTLGDDELDDLYDKFLNYQLR